jgi:uncharacterized protein with ParB-like and HNH nuclease domain
MTNPEVYLHTTHRTISWFRKAYQDETLDIAPNFQRHAVWTNLQKSYLIDTVLSGLPIPEIYMQDPVSVDGTEKHIVVDGQQRIRSVLEFVDNSLILEGDDVSRQWRGRCFDDLSDDEKRAVFAYKFVARILPPRLTETEIRAVFSRINKNVEALTDQELRNSTYSGPFIQTIKDLANDDPFWSDCGVFSSNDYRRMNDQEYISELVVAHLFGPQNKKDKLDQYYADHEETFEDRERILKEFKSVTGEISRLIPKLRGTRWRKKSDFYTLFLALSRRIGQIPFDEDRLNSISEKLAEFGEAVDQIVGLDEDQWADVDDRIKVYARNVARAASDRNNRIARSGAFVSYVLGEPLLPPEILVPKEKA